MPLFNSYLNSGYSFQLSIWCDSKRPLQSLLLILHFHPSRSFTENIHSLYRPSRCFFSLTTNSLLSAIHLGLFSPSMALCGIPLFQGIEPFLKPAPGFEYPDSPLFQGVTPFLKEVLFTPMKPFLPLFHGVLPFLNPPIP